MKYSIVTTVFLIGLSFFNPLFAVEKAPQKVIDLAKKEFVKLGEEAVIVAAVKAENAKKKTLAQIKEMDEKWRNTPGIADFMKAIMDSECGKFLKEKQKKNPYIAEIFVMDNQGANVAMTDKTSDYWQGDEAKFIKSFNNGKGGMHIGDIKFDESTQAYLVQISVAVLDGKKVIGAMTIGVDIDRIE
jgi:hypothetical protein